MGCGASKAHIRTLLACPGTSIEPSYSYGLNGEPAQALSALRVAPRSKEQLTGLAKLVRTSLCLQAALLQAHKHTGMLRELKVSR
jgi:hypothetical protein